jgi:hypothetical protein
MRGLHSDLATAQKVASRTPYIKLYFTKTDHTTYTYTTADVANRIKSIRHVEEAYNDYAIIILEDSARGLPDLTGYRCDIGYGYLCAGGVNRYSDTYAPPLWVKKQQHSSRPGDLDTILFLEGSMGILRSIHNLGWLPD